MKILTVAITAFLFACNVQADRSYTKHELNKMVSAGEYLEQGPVSDTQARIMTFGNCKVSIDIVMSQMRAEYPVRTIVDTSIMYLVKAWTNDGAVTATCSELDQKMVITRAPYQ